MSDETQTPADEPVRQLPLVMSEPRGRKKPPRHLADLSADLEAQLERQGHRIVERADRPHRADTAADGDKRCLREPPRDADGKQRDVIREVAMRACGLTGSEIEQVFVERDGGRRVSFRQLATLGVSGGIAAYNLSSIRKEANEQLKKIKGVSEDVILFVSGGPNSTLTRNMFAALRDQIGNIDVQRSPGIWGGYATPLYLPPDSLLLPVPDGLDPVLATVFNPLGAGLPGADEGLNDYMNRRKASFPDSNV